MILLAPFRRLTGNPLIRDFARSLQAMAAFLVLTVLAFAAILTPFIALTNPYDLATLDLMNSRLPPAWHDLGEWPYLLGTDSQGGDLLSLILYGMRTSILVGILAVALSVTLGTVLGLLSGYLGGWTGAIIMRAADVQFTFPAIILALLIGGLARGVLSPAAQAQFAIPMVVLALGISHWPHFARLVRGAVLVERNKDYIAAARLAGRGPGFIMLRQLLPNVVNPIAVLATLDIAFAVMGEATLSFLGFGLPPTEPSLGTLIRSGYNYLFSGEWWLVIFPSLALMLLVVAVNVFGDWLRDALNPQLR
ncbi:ABC transporter permease [Pararhodobacter sp. SW119]|uniref:ABC transporter permease n=1 Tax=Pararhodobacter sp. SW119 TaxID=2780075 RepID=UPI001AE0032F|nr:ABC transporter permease [Pararhodobacter sp. SW119]